MTRSSVYGWCREFDVASRRRLHSCEQRRAWVLLVPELGVAAVAEKAQVTRSAVYGWCSEFDVSQHPRGVHAVTPNPAPDQSAADEQDDLLDAAA